MKFEAAQTDKLREHKSNSNFTRGRLLHLLIIVMIVLQAGTLFFLLRSPLAEQSLTQQIVRELSQKTSISPNEIPSIQTIADVDTLKGANEIQAEVYAKAQNGDFVVAFSDQMIIYRRNTGEIIYQGDSPGNKVQKLQNILVPEVFAAAKAAKLVAQDSADTPQLTLVVDPAVLQKTDAKFYATTLKDDIIAVFPLTKQVLVYRPSEKRIIVSGSVQTAIVSK